jgi:hypothetical protein
MHELATKLTVENVKDISEIAAIIIGGFWTYLNYFRGRIYKPRLECTVDASIEKDAGRFVLKAVTKIRNVGLSKVRIAQKGTGLLVHSMAAREEAPQFPVAADWNGPVAAFAFGSSFLNGRT